MAQSLMRYDGNREEGLAFMKKVADVLKQGEELGHPTRARVIAALEANRFDMRVAVRKLKAEYRDVKDARLKEEYRKNMEQQQQAARDKAEMDQAVTAGRPSPPK